MKKLLLALALLTTSNVHAIAGGQLLGWCLTPNSDEFASSAQAVCVGFITGVGNAHNVMIANKMIEPLYCITEPLTNAEIVGVAADFFKRNPSKMHLDAAELTLAALIEAYPNTASCKLAQS
tara:strand:+ start:341 stop:706 length:366 start_codon:yes stop_codon:yes gene_type:complete